MASALTACESADPFAVARLLTCDTVVTTIPDRLSCLHAAQGEKTLEAVAVKSVDNIDTCSPRLTTYSIVSRLISAAVPTWGKCSQRPPPQYNDRISSGSSDYTLCAVTLSAVIQTQSYLASVSDALPRVVRRDMQRPQLVVALLDNHM